MPLHYFVNTFENRIDSKGRVSVPAPFRAALDSKKADLYLYKSLEKPCIIGCGHHRITQIIEALDRLDSQSDAAKIWTRILASAQEMRIDSEGRIMLSANFIDYIGVTDSVSYAGTGQQFEIWHPEPLKKNQAELEERVKITGMPSLPPLHQGTPPSNGGS